MKHCEILNIQVFVKKVHQQKKVLSLIEVNNCFAL